MAIDELAAFVNWRRSQVAQQEKGDLPPATEFESGWDLLNIDQKTEWLPEDTRAFLEADAQWAALLTDQALGGQAAKVLKSEKVKARAKQQGVT